jgi:hypothetical protein
LRATFRCQRRSERSGPRLSAGDDGFLSLHGVSMDFVLSLLIIGQRIESSILSPLDCCVFLFVRLVHRMSGEVDNGGTRVTRRTATDADANAEDRPICAVCRDKMTSRTAPRRAGGHGFHEVCSVAWKQRKVNCPICGDSEMPRA